MVETQLRRRGIHDEGVLRAMREIPREGFAPAESRLVAYQDEPTHIGNGQTISRPYMTALMAGKTGQPEHGDFLLRCQSAPWPSLVGFGAMADAEDAHGIFFEGE